MQVFRPSLPCRGVANEGWPGCWWEKGVRRASWHRPPLPNIEQLPREYTWKPGRSLFSLYLTDWMMRATTYAPYVHLVYCCIQSQQQRALSSSWTLLVVCGCRQTFLHVLNNCKTTLHLRHYNTRHGRVLAMAAEIAESHLPRRFKLLDQHSWSDLKLPLPLLFSTTLGPKII